MMKTFPDIPGFDSDQKLSLSNSSNTPVPVKEKELQKLIRFIEKKESVNFSHIELVYVDENEITGINGEYLGRDYVTDIISFRYDDEASNQNIEGTLFCCAPRIAEQSEEFDAPQKTEFYRIFVHGLLHLCRYNDQALEEKKAMTELENHYLEKLGLSL